MAVAFNKQFLPESYYLFERKFKGTLGAVNLPYNTRQIVQDSYMPRIIKHHRINIVILEPGEAISDHCQNGNIAIVQGDDGWWTHFVGENGETDTYDAPFNSYNEALWTAKAAAEFSSSSE